jgi:2-polyprenyl-6-hydroxyphenyl methylase/3-demethylubiquinone-9 3-methyltransferase
VLVEVIISINQLKNIMQKIAEEVYNQIDNDVYHGHESSDKDVWWHPDTVLYLLKTSINPWRMGYCTEIINRLNINPHGKTALEVGCGGGILTEDVARMGFTTTGIDPSEGSIESAIKHAEESGLEIKYDIGMGEDLPYPDNSFDVLFCCDVLEHVMDLPKVIEEIARVLKPGGLFLYDTLNRTLYSKLVAIKIWQEWKWFAFMPPNLHVWEMFIKPKELISLMDKNGLQWK